MVKTRKHRMRKGGGLWGESQPPPQNTLNNLSEDVKSSLSSLGSSISENWNKLSNNISEWVNSRKQPQTNMWGTTMSGGKRRIRRTKKHTKKRKTRSHK